MRKLVYALIAGLAAGLLPPATTQAANCSISTTPVSFGFYDVFSSAALDITGSITFNCDAAASVSVVLGKGGSSTYNPRRMLSGVEQLNYNLYLDAAKSTIWGDGSGSTSIYTNASTPANQNVTVTIYGSVPARQNAKVGAYSDTVTVTINY